MAQNRQRGFTMIEFMLVTIVATPLILLGWQLFQWQSARTDGQSLGNYAGELSTAVNLYIEANSDILGNATPPNEVALLVTAGKRPVYQRGVPRIVMPGDANQLTDGYRQNHNPAIPYSGYIDTITKGLCSDGLCAEITVADLKAGGFIPEESADTAPDGTTYIIRIRRNSTSNPALNCTNSRLDAVLVADRPAMNRNGGGADATGTPIGDPNVLDGMRAASKKMSGALMVSRPAEASDIAAIGAMIPAVSAAATPASGAMAFFGEADHVNNKLGAFFNPTLWGFDPATIKEGTPAIRLSEWTGNKDGIYLRLDGLCPMTGPLNMNGNLIINPKQVKLGDPCDPDPIKAKALEGAVATFAGVNPDPNKPTEMLGAGYGARCGYDQASQSFVWKTSSPQGLVEDVQAGTKEWQATNSDMACWGGPANDGAALVDYSLSGAGVYDVVFLIWHGDAWAYARGTDGKYHDVTRTNGVPNAGPGTGSAGGYDLGYNWSWANAGFGQFPVIVKLTNGSMKCIRPGVEDPNMYASTGWSLSPQGVKFSATGVWATHPADDYTGTAENYANIPVSVNGSLPATSCTTDALGVQTCSTSNVPVNLTGTTAARSYGSWVYHPINQHQSWGFTRTLKCGGRGSDPRPSSIPANCIF